MTLPGTQHHGSQHGQRNLYLPGDGVRARDLERPLLFNKEGGLEPRGPLIS